MIRPNKLQPEPWNDGPPFEDFLGREGAPAVACRHLCSGGGKSGTSTATQNSSISAPGNVTAWGTDVWNRASAAADAPFQQYGGEFVAPVNAQQNTGIANINTAAGAYAPYGQAATAALGPAYQQAGQTLNQGLGAGAGLTFAGAQPVSAANINQYMSPYIQSVVQATENQQNQQNQQQQSQLQGNAISSGAFGGDRGGVAAANLAYQQNLANQPVIAGLYNQGYNTALGAAQQQQQTELAAGNQLFNQGLGASQQQAALGSGLSQGLSNLGTTEQTNELSAANAQLGAGTLQQQTQQAQDTAVYNQFLQQQAYPFQTSQFLANVLQGVGPLYGSDSTTTGSQTAPTSFFSDERLKEDIEPIGKTFDGQNIIKFRYKGSPHTQIGLSAQNVEKHHPRAVGLAGGFKTVDYDEATRKAAARGHFAGGGDVQMALAGDRWTDPHTGESYESIGTGTPGDFDAGDYGGKFPLTWGDPSAGGKRHFRSVSPTQPYPEENGLAPLEWYRRIERGYPGSADGGRINRAGGGGLSGNDNDPIAQLVAAQAQMYPFAHAGLYGQPAAAGPHGIALSQGSGGRGLTPPPSIQMKAQQPESLGQGIQGVNQAVTLGENLGKLYSAGKEGIVGAPAKLDAKGNPIPNTATGGFGGYGGTWGASAPSAAATAQGAQPVALSATPVFSDPTATASLAAGLDPSSVEGLIADGIIPPYRSGGRVGLAYGGMPYANEVKDPIVPEDIADPVQVTRLATPPSISMGQQGQGGGGGLGGLSQLAGLGSSLMSMGTGLSSLFGAGASAAGGSTAIASMLPFLALKSGGRVHKEGGGAAGDPVDVATAAPDFFETKIVPRESGGQHFDKSGVPLTSSRGARGVSQVMPDTAPEAAKLAGVPWNPELFNRGRTGDPAKDKEAEDYNRSLGKAYYNEQLKTFGHPVIAAAAYNAGPQAVKDAQAKAQQSGGSYLDYLPKETQAYAGGMSADPNLALNVPAAAAPAAVSTPAPADPPGWFERNERPIISALTGLAGMASSPSRYLGSAILQGLGAGAQTYAGMGYKERELGLQGGQLGVAQQQAHTAQERVAIDMAAKNLQLLTQLRQIAAGYASKGAPVPPQIAQQIAALTDSIAGGARGAMGPAVRATLPSVSPSVVPTKNAPTAVAGPGAPAQPAPLPPAAGPAGLSFDKPAPPPTVTDKPLPIPATKPEPAPAPAIPKAATDPGFLSKLDPNNNPFELQKRALEANAFSPGSGDKLMDQSRAILDHWNATGSAIDKDGNSIPIPGAKETAAAKKAEEARTTAEATQPVELHKKAQEAQYEIGQKARTTALAEAQNANQALIQAQAMKDLMFDKDGKPRIKGGPAGEQVTKFAALAKQAGFSDQFIKDWTGTDPNAAQSLQKLTTIMGSEIARQELAGSPVRVAEFQRFLQSTPSDQLLPEAFRWIIDKTIIPKSKAVMGAYEKVADMDPYKENIPKELYNFGRDNPWYRPRDEQPAAPAAQPAPAPAAPAVTPETARAELARRRALAVQ